VTSTVRSKLAIAITVVISTIAVAIYAIFPARLERQALRAIADKAESVSEMTAFAVSAPLLFGDHPGVEDAIGGALRNTDLAYLLVTNDSGQIVNAHRKRGTQIGGFVDMEERGASPDGSVYRTVVPIAGNGRRIGTLYLGLFLTDVQRQVREARQMTALGSAILVLLGAAAAFGIGTLVANPLREIVSATGRIAAGDLTHRATVTSRDEVGQLAVAFNGMVAKLADAQADLGEANRTLETRVARRTDELRSSEARFRGVVGSLAEGVVVTDRDDVIEHVNERAAALAGLPVEQLVGRVLREALVPQAEWPEHLRRVARRLNEGKSDRREMLYTRPDGSTVWLEVGNVPLRDDTGHIVGSVATVWELTERKRLEEQLRHDAGHDSLTGLPNRANFLERLDRALRAAADQSDDGRVVVMFLDLDDFKKINDSLGHAAGDVLLREISARLLNATRGCDTVARLGGDEFAVLLENVGPQPEAEIVARRILTSLARPLDLEGTQVTVTTSIGIARGRENDGPMEVLRNADVAMYSAKQLGKETYAFFAHDMHQAAILRLEVEAELRLALEREELRLVYQPIVDLRNDGPVGFEALIRWAHPRRGPVGPNVFIPIAESTGLIVPIGRWVLHQACRQAVAWNRERAERGDQPPLAMSVNVSARQLRDGPRLVEDVRTALGVTGLPPAHLQLEITETLIMSDADATLTTLSALSALGVKLAIDDFGTGYSSLSYLERFPVDVLKIDKTFVDRLAGATPDSPLPAAIIRLGRTLGLRVVAEGIETAAQAHCLVSLGCEFGQGFLFARPRPASEIEVAPAVEREAAVA
jgi:diguanylate cyclase (GGDEF)-like protein/PAS domain S-box-containing protein